eukprot:TRINITY_DN7290_c0_g1_i1.p1 TRINITY_DN7290_c0_g1~~TRINITY_DN7290_c0_g1_i1.p1  ORF type:complete len:313 (+),score=52.02 TRINITY_DN7290_c0_g1_i1:57-941(+)
MDSPEPPPVSASTAQCLPAAAPQASALRLQRIMEHHGVSASQTGTIADAFMSAYRDPVIRERLEVCVAQTQTGAGQAAGPRIPVCDECDEEDEAAWEAASASADPGRTRRTRRSPPRAPARESEQPFKRQDDGWGDAGWFSGAASGGGVAGPADRIAAVLFGIVAGVISDPDAATSALSWLWQSICSAVAPAPPEPTPVNQRHSRRVAGSGRAGPPEPARPERSSTPPAAARDSELPRDAVLAFGLFLVLANMFSQHDDSIFDGACRTVAHVMTAVQVVQPQSHSDSAPMHDCV